jgi:hypothetical protein
MWNIGEPLGNPLKRAEDRARRWGIPQRDEEAARRMRDRHSSAALHAA